MGKVKNNSKCFYKLFEMFDGSARPPGHSLLEHFFLTRDDVKKTCERKILGSIFFKAVAISPLTAICPWNLFCRNHSRVFI